MAVQELLCPLLGRLLIGANEIDPRLNVPIVTDDVGAIFQHLFLWGESLKVPRSKLFNRPLLVSARQIAVIASQHEAHPASPAPSPRFSVRETTGAQDAGFVERFWLQRTNHWRALTSPE